MADLVAVLKDGVLQQLGPPLEIYDHPANRYVATFVGSPPLNVLPGLLDADRKAFVVAGTPLPLPEPAFAECAAHDVAELGVRPEDLTVGPASTDGLVPGEVYVVEPLGNETLVEVRIGESIVAVRAERGWDAPIGSPIGVRIDPATACFFEADGATAFHRTDRPETRRPDRAAAVGGSPARERSVQ